MAYDPLLEERIDHILNQKKIPFESKKMMGGLCYMVDHKMCVGVIKDELMARISPESMKQAMARSGCRPMDFTGRPMKGYIFVSPIGIDMEKDLEYYIDLALAFNPLAKSSKKKKKKSE